MNRWIQDAPKAEQIIHKAKRRKTKNEKDVIVNDIGFTPHGRQIASGLVDAVVRLLDVWTKARLDKPEG